MKSTRNVYNREELIRRKVCIIENSLSERNLQKRATGYREVWVNGKSFQEGEFYITGKC